MTGIHEIAVDGVFIAIGHSRPPPACSRTSWTWTRSGYIPDRAGFHPHTSVAGVFAGDVKDKTFRQASDGGGHGLRRRWKPGGSWQPPVPGNCRVRIDGEIARGGATWIGTSFAFFHAVASAGSFTHAGQTLRAFAQSAVSRQIQRA